MGLTNVLTAIQADLVANLTPPLNAVTFRLGKRELVANDAPPRIVWVRGHGTFGPSEQGVRSLAQARPLRTHRALVEAHVWTSPDVDNGDDTDCETLKNALVASVYRVAHGSFEAIGDDWPQPEWLTHGFLCVVAFEVRSPVTDFLTNTTTTTVTSIPFDQSTAPPPAGTLQAPGDT